ncbi:MAG: cysteine--tRNA ligase [Opitutaceae bacterium]
MSVQLYDSLSRQVRLLKPEDGQTYRFYCCGPTVYGPAHIGNFRAFIVQDVLRRTLEVSGLKTLHVRNLTDVDDKTIAAANREGSSLRQVTDRWTDLFHRDCELLGLLPPHAEPRATEHIDVQIEMIARLVDGGHAYATEEGSVYFRVSSFEGYGALSRLKEREITHDHAPAGSGRMDADEYDRDSISDFVLWKSHKPTDGTVFWDSPWGPGRPGWHIECSAMSRVYLGDTFDLHAGGVDLMFPHHENEIAQSEASNGKPFARHWMHNAHLMVEGQKMSKSLGNLHTPEDAIARGYSARALRYVLISGHYRQPLNFTWASMDAATSAIRRIDRAAAQLAQVSGRPINEANRATEASPALDGDFGGLTPAWQALCDDLNVPAALGAFFKSLPALEAVTVADEAASAQECLHKFLFALGLPPRAAERIEAPDSVVRLANERWAAKQARDFATADRLRAELAEAGWKSLDRKDGFDLEKI